MKTVVGLYNSVDQANKVKNALEETGFSANNVTIIDKDASSYKGYESSNPDHESVGGRLKHFFSSLSGSDDASHSSYSRGIEGGGVMLAVTVPDDQAGQTADLLQQYGASEIEGGYGSEGYGSGEYGSGSYGSTGSNKLGVDAGDTNFGTGTGTLAGASGSTGTAAGGNTAYGTDTTRRDVTGERVVPVVEEELAVGKREVQRGGVRVYAHVVSEPVSESVNLHEERVVVDRRAVDRPATEADFQDLGPVELTATGEEAVVGKRARVIEEVRVGKEASDRTEQINDTVRHTEVDVEPVAATTTTGSDYTTTDEAVGGGSRNR